MDEAPRLDVDHGGHSRRVLQGFLAMSGTSFAVMVVQLAYAAVTSRLMGPSAFGAYAVALSGIGLLGMVSGPSMGLAAARREHDSEAGDRVLVTTAVLAGTLAAAAGLILAPLWGRLWGVPESAAITRVLSLGLPIGAVVAVMEGILRRAGRTHVVAVRSAVGQLLGMAVGLAAVMAIRQPWTLAVTAVVGGLLGGSLLWAALPKGRLRFQRPDRAALGDVVYGVKAAGINLLRSSSGQLARWSISRYAGAASLGAFNRATTLITIPLETLQRSFNYSLFPELRPGGPVFSSPRAFTDILVLVAWPAMILAPLGYFAAPPFISILLGSEWAAAAELASLAVLMGVVPMIGVPLASALEALGLFRTTTLAWAGGSLVLLVGVVGTVRTQAVDPAMVGMVASELTLACIAGITLSRKGLLDYRRLGRAVAPLVLVQVSIAALLGCAVNALGALSAASLALVLGVGVAEAGIVWALRERTAFGAVARQRNLPGFSTRRR